MTSEQEAINSWHVAHSQLASAGCSAHRGAATADITRIEPLSELLAAGGRTCHAKIIPRDIVRGKTLLGRVCGSRFPLA